MTTTTRWVIGRGLLGSAIARTGDGDRFSIDVPWAVPDEASGALAAGLARFAGLPGVLEIAWCAGRGVTSTPADVLAREVDVFRVFVDSLTALPDDVRSRLRVFLASSVGGAYAGSIDPPFSESTAPAPASEYGRAKLAMEAALTAATHDGAWRSFIGRVTNVYGPGQTMGKGQGLISAVVASSVLDRPVPIFVSLDTLRDYVFEDDFGRIVDAGLTRTGTLERGATVLKIIGSMTGLSVGAILGENRRVRRRRFPIILGGGDPRGQSLDLRVRSEVWTDLDALARTTLGEGLGVVYRAQLAELALGYPSAEG